MATQRIPLEMQNAEEWGRRQRHWRGQGCSEEEGEKCSQRAAISHQGIGPMQQLQVAKPDCTKAVGQHCVHQKCQLPPLCVAVQIQEGHRQANKT